MIGEIVSHYRIVEKLGEGGMGVVYRAEDTKLDRSVALKFLPPNLSRDEEAKSRFIHEAKASSALNHPNIGVIHEIDETPDGRTFIAMAYYEGDSLRAVIDRGGVGTEQALEITSQIAAGLEKAHGKGIVHRDIKPSNILITSDGRPVIIDFGLAKLAGGTRFTKEGSTLGTAAYMSPELAKGGDTDRRSDIFSLGVLLYELLTGELPFRGTHEAALLYEIVHEQPEPLSMHKPGLPGDLQGIIDRALAKNPAERYQSAAEMLHDLEQYVEHSGVRRALDLGRFPESGELGRSRWIWISAVLAAIAVIVTVVVLQMRSGDRMPSSGEPALAVIGFRDLAAPDDITTSASITTLVNLGLEQGSPMRVISQELLYDLRRRLFGSRRGTIEQDQVLEVARKSGAEYFLSGEVTGSGEQRYVIWRLVRTRNGESVGTSRVQGDNPIQLADLIVAEVLPLLGARPREGEKAGTYSVGSMTTESPEAFEHYMAGLLANEGWDFNTAIRELKKAVDLDSTFALAYYELSRSYFKVNPGSPDPLTYTYINNAWAKRSRLSVKDRLRLDAWYEQINDRISKAIGIYQEILTRWPDDIVALKDLTDLLFYFSYHEQVLSVTERGLELYPDEWVLNNLRANSLGAFGRFQEALSLSKGYAERHPDNADAWAEVGQRYYEMGMPDSSVAMYERAIELGFFDYLPLCYISYGYFHKGDVMRAIENHERLLGREDLLTGQRIYLLTNVRIRPGLPVMYIEIGRFEKALSLFEDASQLVDDIDSNMTIAYRRCSILLRMGRIREALQVALEQMPLSEKPYARGYGARIAARACAALDSTRAARDYYGMALSAVGGGEKSWLLMVRAEIELAERNPLAALATFQEMKRKGMYNVGGLEYIEYRENLARAYEMTGQLNEAVKVHEEMLRIYRSHALSRFELGKLYERMNRPADARREYELFLDMWADADEGLPQVAYARGRLAELME